jgi:hypothetical protein
MRSRGKLTPIILTGLLALTIYGVLKPGAINTASISVTDVYVVDRATLRYNN